MTFYIESNLSLKANFKKDSGGGVATAMMAGRLFYRHGSCGLRWPRRSGCYRDSGIGI
ncbi:MAG: hypothetical protein MZU95_01335 [Desulfomicrobium escambiense]|nr:hypothetical protein [Desulfomicrobium escambiense]